MSDRAGNAAGEGENTEYQRSLPAKRMGAGAVIRDLDGRVLIVKPVYKAGWERPGGAVESGESPRAACERELFEELQLSVTVGPMLCVDYNSPTSHYVESLMFLFEVAPLDEVMSAAIRLDPGELSEHRFVPLDEALELLDVRVARRLAAATRQRLRRAYLEDQRPRP
jgi:8-oxo-dGTP diphosphatase